jgi:DNA-binding transcriptional LysR family regulator
MTRAARSNLRRDFVILAECEIISIGSPLGPAGRQHWDRSRSCGRRTAGGASRIEPRHPDTHPDATSAPSIAVELRHLRYFIAVSEELHFGHAATRLHIAQPPLSQAIRKLEEELGVLLLQRTSRVVTLTEPGRVFAAEARKVLGALDLAVTETRRAGGGAGAPLRVGCIPDLPIERLLQFLDALREENAALEVRVAHLPPLDQLALLRDGQLEIGVVHHAEDYEDIEQELLFEGEPLVAYLPPQHPLTDKPILSPADLESEALVMFPRAANGALYDRLLGLLDAHGYRFATVREAGGMYVRDLILAVVAGLGVAVGASSLKDVAEAGSIVVRRGLDPQPAMPGTVLAWHAEPPRQLAVTLAAVREVAQRLRGSSDVGQ